MITHVFFDLDNTLINRDKVYHDYLQYFFYENDQNEVWEKFKDEILEKDNHGYMSRSDFEEYLVENFLVKREFQIYQEKYIVGDFVKPISFSLKHKLSLVGAKYKIGLLTNGSVKNQETKIKNAELDTLFDKDLIFISENIGYKKPRIETFQFIEEKMQLSPVNCLIIGDDPINDIEGGKNAGWNTIHTTSNQILQTIDELLK